MEQNINKDTKILIQPIKIGSMVVKNRMVMPPMNTNFTNIYGEITPQAAEYFVRRAKGGVGMIVLEAASVTADVINHEVQPLICDRKYIPGWNNLIERIQSYGVKVSIEIVHYGSECAIGPKFSASNVCSDRNAIVTPLNIKDIIEIEEKFVSTIINAKLAGCDAVTLHAAHGYLIAEFLSPIYNKRTDKYGGSLENRCRFLLEIIEKSKKAVGDDFPIMVRISGDEYIVGGREIDETCAIAKLIEKAGVCAIDISGGIPSTYLFSISPYNFPGMQGFLVKDARRVKEAVNIPVIVAGGIRDVESASRILNEGSADLVALGRTLIADPDFCIKVSEKKSNKVRECLSCQHCLHTLDSGRGLRCAVNPEVGREYLDGEMIKAKKSKNVLIIGAGPAGMEAARVCALRGHKVVLAEREARIGGTLNIACIPPGKEKIRALIEWYEAELEKLGVKVKLNCVDERTLEKEIIPDTILYAMGAYNAMGIKGSENAITAAQALQNKKLVGDKVIIIGGGATGSETAEFFTEERVSININRMKNFSGDLIIEESVRDTNRTKEITIIEMMSEVCSDMEPQSRTVMLHKLKANGINILTNAKVREIGKNYVVIEYIESGKTEKRLCDTVIVAGKLCSSKPQYKSSFCNEIGDCRKPGKISEAIYDGYCAAKNI